MWVLRPLISALLLLVGLLCAATAQAQADANYTLGPGDTIQITVFGEEDLSMKLVIGDSGKLNYPFLGELQVSGLSVKQLEGLIADGLRGDYLLNPDVTVTMEGYRPFYVNGEVKRPGGYPYHPGLTLQKAIAMAYVDPGFAAFGTEVALDIRGKSETARVVSLPFYKRPK